VTRAGARRAVIEIACTRPPLTEQDQGVVLYATFASASSRGERDHAESRTQPARIAPSVTYIAMSDDHATKRLHEPEYVEMLWVAARGPGCRSDFLEKVITGRVERVVAEIIQRTRHLMSSTRK